VTYPTRPFHPLLGKELEIEGDGITFSLLTNPTLAVLIVITFS
jgi:hypothetical protein